MEAASVVVLLFCYRSPISANHIRLGIIQGKYRKVVRLLRRREISSYKRISSPDAHPLMKLGHFV